MQSWGWLLTTVTAIARVWRSTLSYPIFNGSELSGTGAFLQLGLAEIFIVSSTLRISRAEGAPGALSLVGHPVSSVGSSAGVRGQRSRSSGTKSPSASPEANDFAYPGSRRASLSLRLRSRTLWRYCAGEIAPAAIARASLR